MSGGAPKRKLKDTSPEDNDRRKMSNLTRTPTSSLQSGKRPQPRHEREEDAGKHRPRHVRELQQEGEPTGMVTAMETGCEEISDRRGRKDDSDMMAFLRQFKEDITESVRKVENGIGERIEDSETRIMNALECQVGELRGEIQVLKQRNGELERRMERMERECKRRNAIITGIEAPPGAIGGIINAAIKKEGGIKEVELEVTGSFESKKGERIVRVVCKTQEDKRVLMKSKKCMEHRGRKFFINDDLTREEQAIQYKARCFAKERKGSGKANVAYKKVFINDKEYRWCEEKGDFVEKI